MTNIPQDFIDLIELRRHLPYLQCIYQDIVTAQAQEFLGIYPVFIEGDCRGVRLGSKAPREQGSLCFLGGVHHHELGGLVALGRILELWKTTALHARRETLPGDIYLMFGGEKQRMQELFSAISDASATRMSIEQFTDYRLRRNDNGCPAINGNRVPLDADYEKLSPALKRLVDEFRAFEQAVYRHCAWVGDFHSLSQDDSPSIFMPNTRKDEAENSDYMEAAISQYRVIAETMRCEHFIPSIVSSLDHYVFSGEETSQRSSFSYEGGGSNTDPAVWENCANGAIGMLYAVWQKILAGIANMPTLPPPRYTMRVYGTTTHYFLPESVYFNKTPQEALVANDAEGTGALWNLVTGYEPLPEAVIAKLQAMGLSCDIQPGRLRNGRRIRKGDVFAYACSKDGKVSLLCTHQDGTVFMAPKAGRNLEPDCEATIGNIVASQEE